MNMNEWAHEIHENAKAHGWWDTDRGLPEILMLIVSELSEALEEYRAGRPMVWYNCNEISVGTNPCNPQDEADCLNYGSQDNCMFRGKKPEGIAVEVIDALIRILDWCGKEGVDVEALVNEKHEYNKTRPYKHGKIC